MLATPNVCGLMQLVDGVCTVEAHLDAETGLNVAPRMSTQPVSPVKPCVLAYLERTRVTSGASFYHLIFEPFLQDQICFRGTGGCFLSFFWVA